MVISLFRCLAWTVTNPSICASTHESIFAHRLWNLLSAVLPAAASPRTGDPYPQRTAAKPDRIQDQREGEKTDPCKRALDSASIASIACIGATVKATDTKAG